MRPGLRTARLALAAMALAAAGVTIAPAPAPANASAPAAIELADHALTSSAALADESPYQLIDPIGPGAATRDQAIGEVTSKTMIGGIYTDSGHASGGYGQ
jgi:hypothetical protein